MSAGLHLEGNGPGDVDLADLSPDHDLIAPRRQIDELEATRYLTPAEISELLAKGAVGDVLGRYIDADGHIVDPALDARTMGLTLDELREVPRGIAVLSGADKHAVASAIVSSGLASVLITDEETARHVLAR